ncbi:SpoIIE family protein phosphatase [Halomonas sp. IOP_14]|uniref:protein phosphatase 2C domain-containing protein n=1 Tax=Halomonas sp. IOP_14 TaxID=2873295 RepID=UPI001E3F58BA|nr:protein phosphatase 2C domain-containing protein [Halomonas sp. IOP_14]MCD1588194.1 SpoIIE family protein phosphatase [Halomonas sp. IOP_14]
MQQASWFSRQGGERARNSDAAAVIQREHTLLAVLVDGAEKGPNGLELARHWANVSAQALLQTPNGASSEMMKRLREEQQRLRHTFLHDIASYCMMALDLKTRKVQLWHCGDCLVGVQHGEEIRWLTAPHTLAMQPGLSPLSSNDEHLARQQRLTRCLNARRFTAPDHCMLTLPPGQTLLLATDGYWQEHLEVGTPILGLCDDASLLSLPTEGRLHGYISQHSDTDNFNEQIHK